MKITGRLLVGIFAITIKQFVTQRRPIQLPKSDPNKFGLKIAKTATETTLFWSFYSLQICELRLTMCKYSKIGISENF